MEKASYIQNYIVFALFILLCSCKTDYYFDGGVLPENAGKLNVSNVDYLKQNASQFDTLVILLQLTGLEEVVNRANTTFMAPRNYSISNYFKIRFLQMENPPTDIYKMPEELVQEIKMILGNYIIPNEKITIDNLTPSYSYFTTFSDQTARFNILRSDYLGNVNKGAELINFSLNKSLNPDIENYRSVLVNTSNLHSTTGIIHLLDSDTHVFGFN